MRYATARHFLTVPETPDRIAVDSLCFEDDAVRFRRLSDRKWLSASIREVSEIRRDGSDAALAGWLSGTVLGAGVVWLLWNSGKEGVSDESRGYRDAGYILLGLIGAGVGGAIGGVIGNSAGSQAPWSAKNPGLNAEIRTRTRCPGDPETVSGDTALNLIDTAVNPGEEGTGSGPDSLRTADSASEPESTSPSNRPPDLKREMQADWIRQRIEDSVLSREQGRHRLSFSGGRGLSFGNSSWGSMRVDYAWLATVHKKNRYSAGAGYGFRPDPGQYEPEQFAALTFGAARHGASVRSPTWVIRTELQYSISKSQPGETIPLIVAGFAMGAQIPVYGKTGLLFEVGYHGALESLEGKLGAWTGF